MTTEPQADIVERLLRPWFTNGCEAYQREAAAEITRLRARLEVEPGWSESADGIACRDETIRLQDARIASLRAELAEARLQGRREGLESVVAWLRVLETAELTPPILAFFGDPWGDDGQRLCGEIASAIEREDPATLLKDADHG